MGLRIPNIGEWFVDKSVNQLFEIVAIDERTHTDTITIEVQYVDGEISEYDLDSWARLEVEVAAAPEDWSAPYEMVAEDRRDGGYLEQTSDPLSLIEPDLFGGTDEIY